MQRNAIGFGTTGFILLILAIPLAVASLVPCTGDLNLDDDIDGSDIQIISQELALSTCVQPCLSDFDRDGSVEAYDVEVFAKGFRL